MTMIIKKITPDYYDLENVHSLYQSSFPENEQIPLEQFDEILKLENINAQAYYTDTTFIGFCIVYTAPTLTFFYLLAIVPEMRGHGYGTEIFQKILMPKYGNKPIFCNVENPDNSAPNNSQRLHRINLYKRLGLFLTKYIVIENGETYRIMSNSPEPELKDYIEFLKNFEPGFTENWIFTTPIPDTTI